MTGHEGIKEVEGKNGKKRYQAQVWYERKFITSKTFDSLALAQAFKKTKLRAAVEGTLLSASERRTERELASDLHRPMSEWAKRYIEANTAGHGKNRLSEYDQVGRLLSDKTMWAAAGSIDTDLSFLSFLELYGTEIAERRMPTRRVVKAFDVIEYV